MSDSLDSRDVQKSEERSRKEEGTKFIYSCRQMTVDTV
jgi:hypothetical protein